MRYSHNLALVGVSDSGGFAMWNLRDAARDMKGTHGRDGSLKCGVRNDAVRLAGANQPNFGRKCSGWTSELSGNRPRCLSLFFLHLGLSAGPEPRYAHTASFLVHSPKVRHRLRNVPVYRIMRSCLVSQRDSGVPKPGIPPHSEKAFDCPRFPKSQRSQQFDQLGASILL